MNIAGINYESINDGEGLRTVIYVSGCSHNCKNCHNPKTHDINYGVTFTEELKNKIIENIKKRPFVSGLTLSGGDPLHENNITEVLNFIKLFKDNFPNKTVWLYTGYKIDNILNDALKIEIIKLCDVVVDGRYIDKLRDVTLPFSGSKNQRIIDIKKSLKENKIVLYK